MRLGPPRAGRFSVNEDERGSTAVEFALIFPIFLAVCFGTISGGVLFSDKLAITQGAREAARYGATLSYVNDTNFLTQVREAALDAHYGQLGPGDPEYCVHLRKTDGTFTRLKNTDTSAEGGFCPGLPIPPPSHAHVFVTVVKAGSLNMLLYSYEVGVGSQSLARYEGTTS